MKYYCFSTCLFIAFSGLCQEWLTNYQQSVDYYNNFQLKEARAYAETALNLFRSEVAEPHKNVASITRQLSLICYEQGDLDAATGYGKEEIETLRTLGLDNDPNFIDALSNLSLIHSAKSEYLAAEPLSRMALDIGKEHYDEQSPELAVVKGNYATVIFHLKRDEEAVQLFEESISVLQKQEEVPYDYYNILYNYASLKAANGDYRTALSGYRVLEDGYAYDAPNFDYGAILIKVGDALDNLGEFEKAVEKYKTAISNFDQIGEQESEEYIVAQNNLSLDLQKTGAFDEAMTLMESILQKRNLTKEDNPSSYAITATNYATLLLRSGEISKASEILTEAVTFYTTSGLRKDLTYVNALENKSSIELILGNYNLALEHIDEAIEISKTEKLTGRQYSLYNQKSKVLARSGKFEEARQMGDLALEMAYTNFGEGSIQAGFVQNSLAGIYTELGKYYEAQELYLSSLPIFESIYGREHPEYATNAANYSSLLQLIGNYAAAETYLNEAVETKRRSLGSQNLDFLTTYENLALLYLATARYTGAMQILEEIRTSKEAILDQNDQALAYTYSNLANAKKLVAEYTEAENYFSAARKIYENTGGRQHILYASTINNLALLYQKMGNTKAARPLFEEALEIYKQQIGTLSPDYATALENLATLHQMENNRDKARELLEEALEIDEQILGTEHPLYSKTLHNLASIYEEDEAYDRSKSLYEKSLAIDEKVFGKNHPSYASTLYNLAVLEQALENLDRAQDLYEQVARIRLNILGENHPDYAYSVYGLASIAQKTGDFETARENYEIVINKYLQSIREYFPALSESEKSAFYGRIRPVFEAFMDFAVEYVVLEKGTEQDRRNVLGQLYNLQLSTKALLLSASNKVRNRILSSGNEELIALFQEWIGLKENIVKSLSLSKEEIEQNNINIAELETKANDLEKELSVRSTAFAREFEKEQVTWEDVKSSLKEDEAAIEIIRIRKNLKNDSILYATLILRNLPDARPEMILISNGDVLEDRGFKIYKNSIVYKVADKKSYDVFWKSIDEKLPKDLSNIYLSADGIYNKVNIATLLDSETNQYVVEKYDIRLLSNTKELVETIPEESSALDAQIFGFPKYNLEQITAEEGSGLIDEGGMRYTFGDKVSELPGTLEEINNISAILDQKAWNYNTYTEINASEENIKKLDNPRIFHVATHGFFLEDIKVTEDENEGLASRSQRFNPLMRSGLLFAGAENTFRDEDMPGEEDGILTAYEAMNLNLDNTDLVVMSACETGLGEVKNGEGVYGLQRAFIVAGADNLIMSLWKVNDATTQLLMSTFYNEWFSGKTQTDAFNAAIQTVKKDYANPYYWGAFVMLGK